MRLVLLRHAIAEDRYVFHVSSNGAPDSQRPLAQEGIDKMKTIAAGLYTALDSDVQRVVSSPHIRALQTAGLLIDAIPNNEQPDLEICDLLTPGCSFRTLRSWLEDAFGTVVLVGHEPDMSWLTEQFTGGQSQSVKFGKGAACCISFKDNPGNSFGILQWFLSPKALCKMAVA